MSGDIASDHIRIVTVDNTDYEGLSRGALGVEGATHNKENVLIMTSYRPQLAG